MPAAIVEYNIRILTVLQHIAMLAPLPLSICKTERHLLHKILHLPPNSLGHDEVMDIGFWGLPVLASVRSSAAAASFRTAWRFRDTWGPAYNMLTEAAEGGIDLNKFYKGIRSPDHWIGPAFAVFLHQVWHGGECCPSEEARVELRANMMVRKAPLSGKNGVQKEANLVYRKHLITPKWNELLERRRAACFGQAPLVEASVAARFCRQIGKFNAASAMKTATGAWHTSKRMHEEAVVACLLGCGGEDSLAHYSICVKMREVFADVSGLAPSETECLFHMESKKAVVRCARGFQVYSLLKFKADRPSIERAKEFLTALEAEFPYKVFQKPHLRFSNVSVPRG